MSPATALVIALVLLVANGLFVAAEFALLAARRSRIDQLAAEGDARARSASASLRELSLMLAGAQLGITICSLGLGAVAEPALAHLIEGAIEPVVSLSESTLRAIGFTVGLAIVVFLHMVVGEMAPKSWTIADPERAALLLARPFRAYTVLLRPVIRLLNWLANALVRLCGVTPQDERAMSRSSAELVLLLEASADHGMIEPGASELLTRALRLSGLRAADAMTPREDIVAVGADRSVEEASAAACRSGRTRLIVHDDDDLDRARGVLHAKDLLLLDPDQRAVTAAGDIIRPLLRATEDRPLEDLLVDMRNRHQHLAVVVDADDRVTGLVTLEDVLEEIIGDFEDESDRPNS